MIGGALNSVAGGGSFIAFPALLLVGVPPVTANATNAVALWPASIASALAHRSELEASRGHLRSLGAISVAGGLLGALLLLRTPNTTFMVAVPYLLLLASLVFTLGPRLSQRVRASPARLGGPGATAVQLAISIYGGYFGGGMGIVMLAAFSAMGMTSILAMNALKNALATLINLVAIVTFIASGSVAWEYAIPMIAGASAGGYAGARLAQMTDPKWVRRFVLAVAWTMTAYFFTKTG